MAKRTASTPPRSAQTSADAYRYPDKRKNNPPAKIAAEGQVPAIPKAQYAYNPHLPPILRFDTTGESDALPQLLQTAQQRPLTPDETQQLAAAIKNAQSPWLEWAAKREMPGFTVDPVALHIHERISTQAILKVAARQDVEKSLFADPEMEYRQAVQFYKHDVDWANRMILGDSLQVMSSLARREDLAGKVQMIYMDPPYGIKFASNFQPEVGRRDVKDKDQDLTREPEMVKAYRDTWHLGVHSYLTYLRDRLMVAKELLADTGSIFVQISDENLHHVREIMDEVFGAENAVATICYKKPGQRSSDTLPVITDFILFYARNPTELKKKFKKLHQPKALAAAGGDHYNQVEEAGGQVRALTETERASGILPAGNRVMETTSLTSAGSQSGEGVIHFEGARYTPPTHKHWSASWPVGTERLINSSRATGNGRNIRYRRYFDDFAFMEVDNRWDDTGLFGEGVYVVQTSATAIARCLLMTTDPGDLVLDPTCGSGTTAYVAEQWGRRWITMDTSRVAIAIARQRLLTAKYDFYRFKEPAKGTVGGFIYKTVSHITLESIANNTALDPIFARHQPILDQKLSTCNAAFAKVSKELRQNLEYKLAAKHEREGKKAITDGDRRRWVLPPNNRDRSESAKKRATVDLDAATWYHWEVPFEADADWPADLQQAVTEYRAAWRAKMDEVNACIQASATPVDLVDQPEVQRNVVRVSGPFTVEAVQPPEMTLGDAAAMAEPSGEPGFGGSPQTTGPTWQARMVEPRPDMDVQNLAAYLHRMTALLRTDGVRFPNNKQMLFTRLEPLFDSGAGDAIHAEGNWHPGASRLQSGSPSAETNPDKEADIPGAAATGPATVGVVFGPQYGPVTAKMVEEVIKPAGRRYDDLVIAGFSFSAEAQAIIDENTHPKLKIHIAHIRPDVNPGMEGLLKSQPGGQLFTVFGLPRVKVDGPDSTGQYTVTMEGVDIYNPVDNSVSSTGADKVAAWFLDGDYDGRTFCVTQAFFPDRDAWEKLARALNGKDGVIDAERFEAFSGTVSLAFPAGKHKRAAVKVIDPRGNEVMKVVELG